MDVPGLAAIPVQEQQRKGTHHEEEEDPHSKSSIILDGLQTNDCCHHFPQHRKQTKKKSIQAFVRDENEPYALGIAHSLDHRKELKASSFQKPPIQFQLAMMSHGEGGGGWPIQSAHLVSSGWESSKIRNPSLMPRGVYLRLPEPKMYLKNIVLVFGEYIWLSKCTCVFLGKRERKS